MNNELCLNRWKRRKKIIDNSLRQLKRRFHRDANIFTFVYKKERFPYLFECQNFSARFAFSSKSMHVPKLSVRHVIRKKLLNKRVNRKNDVLERRMWYFSNGECGKLETECLRHMSSNCVINGGNKIRCCKKKYVLKLSFKFPHILFLLS